MTKVLLLFLISGVSLFANADTETTVLPKYNCNNGSVIEFAKGKVKIDGEDKEIQISTTYDPSNNSVAGVIIDQAREQEIGTVKFYQSALNFKTPVVNLLCSSN